MNCYCCKVIAVVEKGDTPFVSLKKVVYATHPDAPDQLKSSSVLRSTNKIAFKRYVNPICSYSSCLLTYFDLCYDDSLYCWLAIGVVLASLVYGIPLKSMVYGVHLKSKN